MVKSCCVKSCRAEWSPISPLSFFSIPMKDAVLFNKWKEAIPNSKLGKYSSVCSKHFLSNEIQRVGARTKLTKNAVPSILIDERSQPTALIDHTYLKQGDATPQVMYFSQDIGDDQFHTWMETSPNCATGNLNENEPYHQLMDVPEKKDVSVQTSPRRVGPSEREIYLQRKIRILQAKLRRREKRIACTRELVDHLKNSGKSTDNLEEVLLENFSGMDLELFRNHVNNNIIEKNHRTYTPKMKEFASTLYFHSPQAYCFIRKNLNLPHPATLRKWFGHIASEITAKEDAEVAEITLPAKRRKVVAKRLRETKVALIIDPEVEEDETEELEEIETVEEAAVCGSEKALLTPTEDVNSVAIKPRRGETVQLPEEEFDPDEDADIFEIEALEVESDPDRVDELEGVEILYTSAEEGDDEDNIETDS